jgi:hypothetical protein
MYFARVLMQLYPQLRWKLFLGSKRNVDYGQPVLEGFRSAIVLNPVAVSTVIARKAAQGEAKRSHLRATFETWREHAEIIPADNSLRPSQD